MDQSIVPYDIPPDAELEKLMGALPKFQAFMMADSGSESEKDNPDRIAANDSFFEILPEVEHILQKYSPWVDAMVSDALASNRFSDFERERLALAVGADISGRSIIAYENIKKFSAEINGGELGFPVVASVMSSCGLLTGMIILELTMCPATDGVGCALAAGTYVWGAMHGCY